MGGKGGRGCMKGAEAGDGGGDVQGRWKQGVDGRGWRDGQLKGARKGAMGVGGRLLPWL